MEMREILPLLSFAMARIPSSMELVGGEANTLPATPAVNIPGPMYPAQNGSCPDPPPVTLYSDVSRAV